MKTYRKKLEIVEAMQWDSVSNPHKYVKALSDKKESYKEVTCCKAPRGLHGDFLGQIICPGTYIVKSETGVWFSISEPLFEDMYEELGVKTNE